MELKASSGVGWHPLGSIIGLLKMLGGFRWLLWTDPNSAEVIEFMVVLPAFFKSAIHNPKSPNPPGAQRAPTPGWPYQPVLP